MSKQESANSRIIIPCRFAYFNCWQPVTQYNGTKKYTVAAVIDKNDRDTIIQIENAIEYVKNQSIQIWGGRIPMNLRLPLHDGDEEKPDNIVFKNSFYINAKSKDAPQIVDYNVRPIIDQSEVYSGCYGKISITLYSYSFGGAKGIAAWLGNVQKLRDGDRFIGKIKAKDEFCVEERGDEKYDSYRT